MSETSPAPSEPEESESSGAAPEELTRRGLEPAEVPPEVQAVVEQVLLSMEQYRGPFPHPDILAGYEKFYPGVTKQIFDDAHAQTTHRMALERLAIEGDNFRANVGLFLGFVIAVAGLGVAAVIAWRGEPGWAVAFGSVDLVGLVTVFVVGRRARLRELDEKGEEMTAGQHQRRRLRAGMRKADASRPPTAADEAKTL